MRYQLWTLLLPVLASAASFESDSAEISNDYVLPEDPEYLKWEYIPTNAQIPTAPGIEIEQGPFGWSIMAFFGSFLNPSSPIKQSNSATFLSANSEVSESDLENVSGLMNCDVDELSGIDASIIKKLLSLKDKSKKSLFAQIAEIGDKAIFELFVVKNLSIILSETYNVRDFCLLVLTCIKINSEIAFFNFMDKPKFPLNGPHAIVVASMHGSKELLKIVIGKQNSLEYTWEWTRFDGTEGYMFDFGNVPLDAALFLGSFKAISSGHLECLEILKSSGVDVKFKDYLLLKKAAELLDPTAFEILSTGVVVPNSVMNEILLNAISSGCESSVKYLLGLDFSYRIRTQSHLVPAINSGKKSIFDLIRARVDHLELNNEILKIAAASGNTEIFIELIKISSSDLVLTALCNCISNVAFQKYVPEIAGNVKLSAEMISQGLFHSVKARSSSMVRLFLANEDCVSSLVYKSLLGALMSNDPELFDPFFAKFEATDMIPPNSISKASETLISLEAWIALRVYVQKYFHCSHFPKSKFTSLIIKTDQVELANYVVSNGARINPSELVYATNRDMHAFAVRAIAEDLSKSQMKKRK